MLKVNPSSVALFFKILQLKTYNSKTMKDVFLIYGDRLPWYIFSIAWMIRQFQKVWFKRQLNLFSTKISLYHCIVNWQPLKIDNKHTSLTVFFIVSIFRIIIPSENISCWFLSIFLSYWKLLILVVVVEIFCLMNYIQFVGYTLNYCLIIVFRDYF